MKLWLTGWTLYHAEKKAHRETRLAHMRTVEALQREERRATEAFQAATEPCLHCERYMHERDEAILELDEVRAALHWLEKDMKLG